MPRYTGTALAEIRRTADVSRADLAGRLGVSVSRIRNLELTATVPERVWTRFTTAVLDIASERAR